MVEKYNKVKNTLCVLPFTHLATHPDGNVTPCCESKLFASNGKKTLNLNIDSIKDIRDSESFNQLKQDMLNGVKNDICNFCYKREEKGIESKRIRENNRWGLNKSTYKSFLNNPLISVELRLGNTCNLKCLICHPWSSSKWNEDAEVVGYEKMTIDRTWFKDKKVYDELTKYSQEVKHLWFNGGEPTLIKEHYYLLEKLIEENKNSDITLEYHTNGSNFPDRLIKLWKKFKRVDITLSIDDIYDRLYYQRFPIKHEEVQKNINKIKKANQGNIQMVVIPTVSLYNVFNLDNLYNFYKKIDIKINLFNYLNFPTHLAIHNIPEKYKNRLLKRYKNTLPEYFHTELEYNLYSRESKGLDKFKDFTKKLDSHRKVSILNYLPEYVDIF